MTVRRAALLGVTALTAPFLEAPALAQEAQNAPAVDRDVIIVTAQRRAEALEDVPMTVTVVNQETLAASGIISVRDLQNVTTGVQLGQGGGFAQPAVRGVTTIINGTFENNVTLYVDDLYQPIAQALNVDLVDVQSVQVLKGPQGTLYGRNATGGVILMETISPTQSWAAKAEATYARFDDKRIGGYVAGPINDMIGISVSGYHRRSDGYHKLASRSVPGETDGRGPGLEQDTVRAKIVITPSHNFKVTLGYNYMHLDDPRGLIFSPYENVVPTYNVLPGGEYRATKFGTVAYDFEISNDSETHEGLLKMELDTGLGKLRSISGYTQFKGYTEFDFDGSYVPNSWSTSRQRWRIFQQAVDYTIDAVDRLTLALGGTYYKQKVKFIDPSIPYANFGIGSTVYDPDNPLPLSAYTGLWTTFYDEEKEAWALYADATYKLTDRLTINVGGRYSEEDQSVSGEQPSILSVFDLPYASASANFSKFTPRASIRYEIMPQTNIYASYSKGFRSGAFNNRQPSPGTPWLPADQETIDAYEVGFKTAQNRFRFEVAGFYYDYKNLQVSSTTTIPGTGTPIVTITNAPSAEVYGIEGSFDVEVLENLHLRAGATWLHARYGDDFTFSTVGVDPTQVGINSSSDPLKTFLNVSQVQDLSGQQMSRAPDFTANVGMDYLIPVGDGGFRFAANLKYTDSYVVTNPSVWGPLLIGTEYEDRANEQRFRQGDYVLLNTSVTWTDPSDSYYLRAWVNNLTDSRYRLHYNGTGSWGTYAPMGEPRTYGLTVGVKFGER
ncbi:TonB-dependent receptor [Novosphingobium malaysiense]|uniref:TonB-dependent receptor n=1 Tax=Novosphingobium malaysiense TaxID=1348853 RepID=A0A0B1ZQJ4_9SPHN|nr:TonB-dependent receptor [Novosphingobium malaysiense]KHK91467.1 hypothetical protein LK12_11580 [Novosphingobium malaysiense]